MNEIRLATEVGRILEEMGITNEIRMIDKNGISHYGIIMGTGNVRPTMYVYELMENEPRDIAISMYKQYIKSMEDVSPVSNIAKGFDNYNIIKNKIIPCLMKAKVDDYVTRQYLDMYVYYRIILDGIGDFASVIIKEEHLNMWNVSEEDIYKQAINNTKGTYLVKTMMSIMCESIGISEEEARRMGLPDDGMYVITNKIKTYGAGALLHTELFKNLAADLKDDLWIIPSSVHELIIIPKSVGTEESITSMIQEVNATEVSETDYLSDHVYRCENTVVIY